MRITKGYDVTPRGTSRHTSRDDSSASLNTSLYSRENSSLSQKSVEKVYASKQVATSKARNKNSEKFSSTPTITQTPVRQLASPVPSRRIINGNYSMGAAQSRKMENDGYMGDLQDRLKQAFLEELCRRPNIGLTEVRRDGKDNSAIAAVIVKEFNRCSGSMSEADFMYHMRTFSSACWASMESLHQQMLDDETPENERLRLDPDHWYENNLTNSSLFANLAPEKVKGMEQLVPGRIFTTRMPRDIENDRSERNDFIEKCKKNNLKVVCVLTEEHEFKKYSGTDALKDFYRNECGLIVYNRAIPDFKIPTHGDLCDNILDLCYHLSQGRNCLIHCAGGTGRTGMVLAAVIQNFGVTDVISRIRKVKSTYVETPDQELFLKNVPKTIDKRIVREKPMLACAIAAEQLIQLFHTHKSAIAKQESKDKKNAYLDSIEDALDVLDLNDEDGLREAYGQTFDMIDQDRSGNLDRKEITDWFEMCGAEIDTSKLIDTMMSDGYLTRDKFIKFMTALAKTHHRDYDLSGSLGGGHD